MKTYQLLGILAIPTLLLASCSKESTHVTPNSSREIGANASNLPLQIEPATTTQGGATSIFWYTGSYGPPFPSALTARVEFTGPAHVIIPHVLLYSYSQYATNNLIDRNGFDFTLPSYLPVGSYHVLVTVDHSNESLSTSSGDTSAEGTLTVNQGQTIQLNGLNPVVGSKFRVQTDYNQQNNTYSFNINWNNSGPPTDATAGLAFKSTSDNTYYLLCPADYSLGSPQYNPDYSYGMENKFNYSNSSGRVTFSGNDIVKGSYQLYFHQYNKDFSPTTPGIYYTVGSNYGFAPSLGTSI